MKHNLIALATGALLLLAALWVVCVPDLVASADTGPGARPSPTPDLTPPESLPATPESPESPEIPPAPDLVVESIVVVPSRPVINQPVTIRVTIRNQGTADVPILPPAGPQNFYTDLYVDPLIVPIELYQRGIEPWGVQAYWLPAGASYTLEAEHVFEDVKAFALYAQVDTDSHVPELNEYNNVLGPVFVAVYAPNQTVHGTHVDFQRGMASSLDLSDPTGVIRRGIFDQPSTEPEVYYPDSQVDDPGVPSDPGFVNQGKPALEGDGTGRLFAVWEDGRAGAVFHRDIYFSRSTDRGATWSTDLRINDDADVTGRTNQINPDLAYDSVTGRLYAVWQDNRDGDFNIYASVSTNGGATWQANVRVTDDTDASAQSNPSVAVGLSGRVYVVWEDLRNGNDDIYLARSDDFGASWSENFFVTDDPEWTSQAQESPSIAIQREPSGADVVYVTWEDWRAAGHPEVYVSRSYDWGRTFTIDVPVQRPAGTSYRTTPAIAVGLYVSQTITELVQFMHDVHVVYQQGSDEDADVYWSYANIDFVEPYECPWPSEICFDSTSQVNGFVIDSEYARPPEETGAWPIEPSWQGQPSVDLAPEWDLTQCVPSATDFYSRGIYIAWSDARTYDDWRYEIHTRRVASPEGFETYELCQDSSTGVLNDNAKLAGYRDDLALYQFFAPAATGQFRPDIHVDESGVYVAWDDDRWNLPWGPDPLDDPEPPVHPDRDVFVARMGVAPDGIYISPVINGGNDTIWYALSWWAATEDCDQLLFQTRFGVAGAGTPPQADEAANGWTRWTGNPSVPVAGCPGTGCYYDAPGRRIVGPAGNEWPDNYRYLQYKVVLRQECGQSWHPFKTAVGQVTVHYQGSAFVYLPLVQRGY